jgi:glutaredoxin-related protein
LGGKFVGGVDIVTELIEAGEFDEMVPENAKKKAPAGEFKELLGTHKVVAVIEGSADEPVGDASKELVAVLKKHGVKYVALDVIKRKDLREVVGGVPSLYIDGTLAGDLNFVKDLDLSGDLMKRFPADSVVETLESKIIKIIN